MNVFENKTIEYSLDQIESIAQEIVPLFDQYKVFTFTGELGAGKTTLVQSLLRLSGVTGMITSPTFTYMNVYEGKDNHSFYHFDLYRINSLDDFNAAGFDEYLYQPNSIALIEWPAVIEPLLDHAVCHIAIAHHDDPAKRILTIKCIE